MTGSEAARSFFEEAWTAGDSATCQEQWCERTYRLAEKAVRYRGTRNFAFIPRALGHGDPGASPDAAPDLEVRVWDEQAIPGGMPPPPWSVDDYGVRGEIREFNDARFATAFDHMGGSLSMFDAERNQAIFWTRDARTLPQSERGAPLKIILHWWLQMNGCMLVHGAAVGNERGAVLLAGSGGAGKSTTAIWCAASGLHYLGDDYCGVEVGRSPQVFSLYGTGKIRRGDEAVFEPMGLQERDVSGAGDEKRMVYMHEWKSVKMTPCLPLRAILIPMIDPAARETTIVPAGGAEALKALAPSTISQLSGAGAQTFARLAELARTIPSYRLCLARDFDRIGGKIREFLEGSTR